jgi:hypothetical protein
MNLNGTYIKLNKIGGADPNKGGTWIVPYKGDIGLSVTQETRQPVKEFFKELGDAIISLENMASSDLAIATSFVRDFSDITGNKFFTKGYYSTAWVGEDPASFTVKLEFFRGWMGVWNSKTEVFIPIMQIMNQTVPVDNYGGLYLSAPMPNAMEAFGNFSTGIVTSIASALTDAGAQILGAVNNALSGAQATAKNVASTQLSKASNDLANLTLPSNRTWEVSFGWCGGDLNSFSTFFSMNQLIVTASSFNFSSTLEQSTDYSSYGYSLTNYYPINGSISLTFKTQNLLASSLFQGHLR